ncbi:MAG: hypothetical protein AMJ54_00385 [Deltaproteobacteria bacterium SG8_13]|nr:MAG: hypothetical protein AMJ54_00385 [Deltaproteobacteria bacterium SG8_13]
MARFKNFLKTSVLGGTSVIMPAVIFFFIFRWLFRWITDLIQPLTDIVTRKMPFPELAADLIVIALILSTCFIIGVIVRTKAGQFLHTSLENRILQIAPGYPMIKSIVGQFLGRQEQPFSKVALVQAFENDTLMTAFITERHADGSFSVFVPTGPNPTTGFIFHLQPQYVHPVKVSVEEAFRTVIGCGAGSSKLILKYAEGKQQ